LEVPGTKGADMTLPVSDGAVRNASPSETLSTQSGTAAQPTKRHLIIDNRLFQRVALTLVIAGGILPRINHIDKSIWSAEAWVCNSVLTDTIAKMFRYPAWLQTTPPLFLVLVRWTVHLVGLSVGSLRAVPFVFSLLALILIAWLSSLILRTPFAVLCTTLVALSPPAVVFSKEVKQYSGDVAASCLLLLVLWMYIERPDRRRYICLAAAIAVSLGLSYTAVTFLPAAIASVATVDPTLNDGGASSRTTRKWRTGILTALTSAVCILNYWLFVKPNTSPLLTDYWSEGYPRFRHLKNVALYYAQYFLGMGVYFYIPMGTKDFLKSILFSTGFLTLLLIVVVTIGVAALAFASLRRNRRHSGAFALCLAPLVALAILNLLHLYPVNSRRLMLFMVPCVSLAIAIVMQNLWDMLLKGFRLKNTAPFSALITGGCILLVFVAGAHSDGWSNYWFEDEDTGGAFRFLKSQVASRDTIYVHASIAESAKLYFRILRWEPGDVRYGNTGWGCCTRIPEPRPVDARDYVVRDFERILGKTGPQRLWLVFTGRDGHWGEIGRDERQIIGSYLEGIGYQKHLEQRFANETVEEFVWSRPFPRMEGLGTSSNTGSASE